MRAVLHIDSRDHGSAPPESSPLKRKYDGTGGNNAQMRLRLIKKVNSAGFLSATSGFLFSTSDMIVKKRSGLVLIRDVLNLSDAEDVCTISESDYGIEAVPNMCALNHLEGNWRELVGSSNEGHVFSAVMDDDGHITTVLHEDLISSEKSPNEIVTTIFHAGDVYVLGTDKGEVFVVSRERLASSVVKLQRPQGLFSIVKSGAAFFWGYAEENEAERSGKRGVVNMFSLPSPDRDLLLCVGVERITLWADWCQSRGHEILWERDMRELLSADIRESLVQLGPAAEGSGGAVTGCQALDAVLVPNGKNRSGSAVVSTIAVLSACAVSSTHNHMGTNFDEMIVSDSDLCSLWVHIIDICGDGGSSYHSIRGRYLVESKLFPKSCGWRSDRAATVMPPRLYLPKCSSATPVSDFYVSWESNESVMHLANCDLGVLYADRGDNVSIDFCQIPRCLHNTDLSTAHVLSVNVIDTLLLKEGVSIVLNDGSVLHASLCPLPFGAVGAEQFSSTGTLDDSLDATEWVELLLECSQEVLVTAEVAESHQNSRMVLEDGVDLLPQFSVLPLSAACNHQLMRLRQFFATATEEAATECAVVASTTICQRLPVGHSWGEENMIVDSGAEGGADYGLVRASLREKCVSHMKLMWVLLSSNGWDSYSSIRQVISQHHSFLKASLGMCLSLAESQVKKQMQWGSASGIGWFLSSGHGSMLEVALKGMTNAVERMSEKEEFSALGLRTVDSFFSQTLLLPRGLMCVAKALSSNASDLRKNGHLVSCTYAVMSNFLSALQTGDSKVLTPRLQTERKKFGKLAVSSEYMGSDLPSSISYNDEARAAIMLVLKTMRAALQELPADLKLMARRKYLQKVGWRREIEGARTILLCSALLQGFFDELQSVDEARLSRSEAARFSSLDGLFNDAKDVCVDVLFLLGHTSDAYEVAAQYVHFRGMLEACEYDELLYPKLYSAVGQYGNSLDPMDNTTPFGIYSLNFFEKKMKLSLILEYSKIIDKAQVHDFFEAHPQLAWIYGICRCSGDVAKDMTYAAKAALIHSQCENQVASATALLSISKLSSVLAMSSVVDNDESSDSIRAVFQSAVSNLAVIRAMEIAVEGGAVSSDGSARMDGVEVFDALVKYVRENFVPSRSTDDDDASESINAINMAAAALAVVAELLRENEMHEDRLVELWALVIEYDHTVWYNLLNPTAATDQLNDAATTHSLKETMVAKLCEISLGDVELGKLSPAVLPNFEDGVVFEKSTSKFFDCIGESNGTKRKQLSHLIAMAIRS